MKTLRISIICFAAAALSAGRAGAVGTAGGRILHITSLPRVAAVGDAYAARADDVSAVSLNPAGLARLSDAEAVFSHSAYLLDTSLTAAAAAWRWGRYGMGLEWKQFFSRDEFRDEMGENDKNFTNRLTQVTLGAGIPLAQRVSAGLSISSVSESLYSHSATALSFGAGVYVLGYRGDSYGFTVKNISGQLKHENKGSAPPASVSAAGAHRMGGYILSWEVLNTGDLNLGWRAGLEADLSGMKLRGGVRYEQSPDFTMGFGIPYGRWTLDYAFSPHRSLGGAHRMSVGALF